MKLLCSSRQAVIGCLRERMWIPFGYGLGSLSVEAKVSAVLLMLLYPRMDEWWATLVKSSFSFIRTPHKAPGCSFVLRRTLVSSGHIGTPPETVGSVNNHSYIYEGNHGKQDQHNHNDRTASDSHSRVCHCPCSSLTMMIRMRGGGVPERETQ